LILNDIWVGDYYMSYEFDLIYLSLIWFIWVWYDLFEL